MKNLSIVFTLLLFVFLGSCTKENVTPTNDSNSVDVVDWVTGTHVGTYTEEVAENRTATTFNNNHWGATTKYSYQADLFQGGVLIASTPVYWFNGGGSYTNSISADCGDLNTTMVVKFGRKVLSIPCTLSISWSMGTNSSTGTETFTIATNGTTKTHVFASCN